MNINTNLVCDHHKLSLSVAGLSGHEFLVVHEQLQFDEHYARNFRLTVHLLFRNIHEQFMNTFNERS